MTTRRIVQIMPAPGWTARMAGAEGEEFIPLVGWALVETEARATDVVGLVALGEVALCDQVPGFRGYAFVEEAEGLEGFVFDEDLDDDLYDLDEDDGTDPRRPKPRLN